MGADPLGCSLQTVLGSGGSQCRTEPPALPRTLAGHREGGKLGHPLLSLLYHRSVHPLRPLHHVRCHGEAAGETPGKVSPPGPAAPAWGLYRPQGCLLCHPGEGVPFPPTSCSRVPHLPQLLEDLDEQLSCTRLEEAAVSRRISTGGCPAWPLPGRGGSGRTWGPSAPLLGSPHEPLGISSLAGKASCWLNLNVELLREQLFAIRSKRRKLGEEPGGGRAQDAWVPSSLALGALVPWEPVPHGGSGARKWGEVGNPCPDTLGPLSISCPGVGARAPL